MGYEPIFLSASRCSDLQKEDQNIKPHGAYGSPPLHTFLYGRGLYVLRELTTELRWSKAGACIAFTVPLSAN